MSVLAEMANPLAWKVKMVAGIGRRNGVTGGTGQTSQPRRPRFSPRPSTAVKRTVSWTKQPDIRFARQLRVLLSPRVQQGLLISPTPSAAPVRVVALLRTCASGASPVARKPS